MTCERALELFSDRQAGSLSPMVHRELEEHLAGCTACAELYAAFVEVVAALQSMPLVEPPAELAERAASAALLAFRATPRPVPWAARPLPRWLRAAAAVAMLATGATLLAAGPEAGTRSAAAPIARRTAQTASFLSEHTERLLEDIRLARIVFAAALEGRLDSLSDRFQEYRRSIERRQAERDAKKSEAGPGGHLLNSPPSRLVSGFDTAAPAHVPAAAPELTRSPRS